MSFSIDAKRNLDALFCTFVKSSIIISLWLTVSTAQVPTHIVPDGSLPTTVMSNGNVHEITDGMKSGPNLFHSFEQFDVGTNHTAYFVGQPGVNNIIGRVHDRTHFFCSMVI